MSFSARVETAVFTQKIQEYQRLTGKAMGEVVREQARLLADSLTKLTYPASASVGKKRVEIDINRVYLKNSWFEDKFQFRNKKLGERVIDAVRSRNEANVETIFSKSAKLRLIRVEPFDKGTHARLRRNGRIRVPDPRSMPLTQQGKVAALVNEKKKQVGTAKAGWAQCAAALGKSVPGWLAKAGTGAIIDNSTGADPSITLINKVGYFSRLNDKANIVSRAMQGRARIMIKSAEKQLALAAKQAGFSAT
jgi:hypothetical protein